jgi:hypothetical protein
MNWTSTKVPLWQIDCENFRRVGGRFELREVSADEHKSFIIDFAKRHDLKVTARERGAIVQFEPQISLPETGNSIGNPSLMSDRSN